MIKSYILPITSSNSPYLPNVLSQLHFYVMLFFDKQLSSVNAVHIWMDVVPLVGVIETYLRNTLNKNNFPAPKAIKRQ